MVEYQGAHLRGLSPGVIEAGRHRLLSHQAGIRPSLEYRHGARGLPFESLTLDLRSNARAFAQSLNDHHIIWVSTLRSNARITYRGRPQPVAEWAKHLPRHRIAGRPWAWVGPVPFPRDGTVRLVVATNGQGGLADIVSNDLHRRGKVLLHQERSRAHQDQLPRH